MPQSNGLGNYVRNMVDVTLYHAVSHTLSYLGGYIFQMSAVAAIGSWTAFMGATIAGAVALYIPAIMIQKLMQTCGLLNPVSRDIFNLLYLLATPVVGAALLNFGFAWTLPLVPVLVCAAVGVGIQLLLMAWSSASPASARAENTAHRQGQQREREASNYYRTRNPFSVFRDDPFMIDPFFNPNLRRGNPGRAASSNNSSIRVEELDDNGNVIGELPTRR